MNKATFSIIILFLFTSCGKTIDVIRLEKAECEKPIEFIYNSRYKEITRVSFYVTYKVENTSCIKRKIFDTHFISGNKRKSNLTFEYLNKKLVSKRIFIEKNESSLIVSQIKSFSKKDTLIKFCDLNNVPDTVYLHGCDTIKRYSYKTIAELQKELPEFLEMYIKKTDSIRFEFDDSELPFYVKRSRYKETLGGKTFEGELEHPWITVSVLGD